MKAQAGDSLLFAMFTSVVALFSIYSDANASETKRSSSNASAVYLKGPKNACPVTTVNPLGQKIVIDCSQHGFPGIIDDQWACPSDQFLTSVTLHESVMYQARMRCQTLASRKKRDSSTDRMSSGFQQTCTDVKECNGQVSQKGQKEGAPSNLGPTLKSLLSGPQGVCPESRSNPLGQRVEVDCAQFGQTGTSLSQGQCPSEDSLNSRTSYLSKIHMSEIECKSRASKSSKKEVDTTESNRGSKGCLGTMSCASGSSPDSKKRIGSTMTIDLSKSNSDKGDRAQARAGKREEHMKQFKVFAPKNQKKDAKKEL